MQILYQTPLFNGKREMITRSLRCFTCSTVIKQINTMTSFTHVKQNMIYEDSSIQSWTYRTMNICLANLLHIMNLWHIRSDVLRSVSSRQYVSFARRLQHTKDSVKNSRNTLKTMTKIWQTRLPWNSYGSIVAPDLLCCTAPRRLLVYRFIAQNNYRFSFMKQKQEKEQQQ